MLSVPETEPIVRDRFDWIHCSMEQLLHLVISANSKPARQRPQSAVPPSPLQSSLSTKTNDATLIWLKFQCFVIRLPIPRPSKTMNTLG